MSNKWLICIIVIIIVEYTEARKSTARKEVSHPATTRVPSKPATARSSTNHGKHLNNQRLGQDYIEQYQEMHKASQESFEGYDDGDEKRLRRLIGDDDLGLMAEAGGVGRRVRSGGRLAENSDVGRRRARSQAVRRDKLAAQSAISHKRHSRPNFIQNDNKGRYGH